MVAHFFLQAGGAQEMRQLKLLLDVLWYTPKALDALNPEILRRAVRRQLLAWQRHLQSGGCGFEAQALHFFPAELGHHCTIVYPLPQGASKEVRKLSRFLKF